MTLPTFKEQELEELFKNLKKFLQDQDSPISKEKYLATVEQLGQEPDPEKIPLGFDDLYEDAQRALNIYNRLGNRIYGDVGFVGKDFTNLPILIETNYIVDKSLLVDLLNVIDAHNIDKNQKQLKKMYDDIKKKK